MIGEGPTAADRYEAGVPDLREDHGQLISNSLPSGSFIPTA